MGRALLGWAGWVGPDWAGLPGLGWASWTGLGEVLELGWAAAMMVRSERRIQNTAAATRGRVPCGVPP